MRFILAILLTLTAATSAVAEDMESTLAAFRHDWAKVYYQTPEDRQEELFPPLAARIDAIAAQYPDAAEPLIWKAIVFSSYAKAKGGLGALDLAETARDAALEAAKRDERALDAGAYTALGALYYKVPGWPIGFGNDSKAKDYLDRALAIAPDAVDVNYFYGDFMLEQGDKAKARSFLQKALQAPPRPDRADEDGGRKREIEADLAKLGG
jgi:tetratricopeptide (TPR) repeat protein